MGSTITPPLNIPSGATAQVKIIDSTSQVCGIAINYFMEPAMPGFTRMGDLPSWSFLVESASGRKILFDLGVRKDWKNLAPHVWKRIPANGWDVTVKKNVAEILEENHVAPKDIDSIILR
jgi:hypothetical protein